MLHIFPERILSMYLNHVVSYFLGTVLPMEFCLFCPNFIILSDIQTQSFQFSCSVVSNSLRPHGLQHVRLPSSSPTPDEFELAQTHVHQVSDAIQPSHPLSSHGSPKNKKNESTCIQHLKTWKHFDNFLLHFTFLLNSLILLFHFL